MEQPSAPPDLTAVDHSPGWKRRAGPRRGKSSICKAPNLGSQHSGRSLSEGGLGIILRATGGRPRIEFRDAKRS